jgi:[ribosomal protein S5]-alanine N-acetyltransferase
MIGIEPIAPEHLPSVQVHASHPYVGATSTVPHPYPAGGAASWFEQVSARIAKGQSRVFAISEDGHFCGVISLNGIDTAKQTGEVDYWVAHDFKGRGIATAAVALVVRYARERLNLSKLFSSCLLRNETSSRVLAKNGFLEIGRVTLDDGKFKGEQVQRFDLRL